MKKYEYMVFNWNENDIYGLRDELNHYGRLGWEVIGFEVPNFSYLIRIWMKRENETRK